MTTNMGAGKNASASKKSSYQGSQYGGAVATATKSSGAVRLTHQQIAQRAVAIWKAKGCPTGRDEQNWLEAEAQLKAELGVR